MKRAGSGAGARSVSQRYRSSDPVPYQNVTDPEHLFKGVCSSRSAGRFKRVSFNQGVQVGSRKSRLLYSYKCGPFNVLICIVVLCGNIFLF